jgi:competence protein ComEA
LAVGLLAWHVYIAGRWSCRPTVLEPGTLDSASIELNRADHAQLLQLPGVSEKLAQRIEMYRAEHRGFRDVDELRRVNGIGPKTLEKLRPHVRVEPRESQPEEQPTPIRTKKPTLTRPIDINRATATELQGLPRIGPVLSQRILEARAKKPFRCVEDLRRVRGIGPKTLEQLRPYVVVEE